MADLISLEEVKLACRVDGTELNAELEIIKSTAQKYVLSAVSETASEDPRTKQAALAMCRLLFRPEEDKQGNLRSYVTMLINQVRTEPVEVIPVEEPTNII